MVKTVVTVDVVALSIGKSHGNGCGISLIGTHNGA